MIKKAAISLLVFLFGLIFLFYDFGVSSDYMIFLKDNLDSNTIIVTGLSWSPRIIGGYKNLVKEMPETEMRKRDIEYVQGDEEISLTGLDFRSMGPIHDAENPKFLLKGRLIDSYPTFEVAEAYQIMPLSLMMFEQYSFLGVALPYLALLVTLVSFIFFVIMVIKIIRNMVR